MPFRVTDRSGMFVFLFKTSAAVDAVVFWIQARGARSATYRIQQWVCASAIAQSDGRQRDPHPQTVSSNAWFRDVFNFERFHSGVHRRFGAAECLSAWLFVAVIRHAWCAEVLD